MRPSPNLVPTFEGGWDTIMFFYSRWLKRLVPTSCESQRGHNTPYRKMYDHTSPGVIHFSYMHVRPRWDMKGWDQTGLVF